MATRRRDLPGVIHDLVEEFVRELTPAMLQSIKDMVSSKRARNRAIQEYMIDINVMKARALIPFTDIISEKNSVAGGGIALRFAIQEEGQEYYIEDLYCPRPACACNDVHLLFFEGTLDSDGMLTAFTDLFLARVPFRGKMDIQEIMKCTMEKAAKILKQFFRHYPDAMEEFISHSGLPPLTTL